MMFKTILRGKIGDHGKVKYPWRGTRHHNLSWTFLQAFPHPLTSNRIRLSLSKDAIAFWDLSPTFTNLHDTLDLSRLLISSNLLRICTDLYQWVSSSFSCLGTKEHAFICVFPSLFPPFSFKNHSERRSSSNFYYHIIPHTEKTITHYMERNSVIIL